MCEGLEMNLLEIAGLEEGAPGIVGEAVGSDASEAGVMLVKELNQFPLAHFADRIRIGTDGQDVVKALRVGSFANDGFFVLVVEEESGKDAIDRDQQAVPGAEPVAFVIGDALRQLPDPEREGRRKDGRGVEAAGEEPWAAVSIKSDL